MNALNTAAHLTVLVIAIGCATPTAAPTVFAEDLPLMGVEEGWCTLHDEQLIEELLPVDPEMEFGCTARLTGALAEYYWPFPNAALGGGQADIATLLIVRHCRTCTHEQHEWNRERWLQVEREGPRAFGDR
jgi:hypothetical protein